MIKPITRDELEQIKAWAQEMIEQYDKRVPAYSDAIVVCRYNDKLPTHSIRSQMLTLVSEVEKQKDALIVALSFVDGKGKEKPDKGMLRMILRERLGLSEEESQDKHSI